MFTNNLVKTGNKQAPSSKFAGRGQLLSWLILFLLVGAAITVYFGLNSPATENYLTVTIFDVGQGDATLIETPAGVQILIDGGPDNSIIRKLSDRLGFADRDLDLVIATHPDQDHIAGLNDVLTRYQVDTVLITEKTGKSVAADTLLKLLDESDRKVVYARAGQNYQFADGTKMEIIFPDRNPAGLESNAASIIVKLQYGEIGFMFTGDSPKQIENYLVQNYGLGLESEVLKLGHHGSDTSTSDLFLVTVQPVVAVASAGKDNRYGHPSKAVLARLKENNIKVLSTPVAGDISFYSDGQQLWFKTEN